MQDYTEEERFNQQQLELEAELDARIDASNLPTANIMVAGITGTGKSTLINAVFGSEMAATGTGRPVTEQIDEYTNDDIPIHIWDTVGLELDSQKTKESIKAIRKTIANKSASNDKYDRVHAIWYCINSGSNRYQGAELEFIKELYSIGVPFIIVLTQCSGDEDEVNAFESKIREINEQMGMRDIRIVQVLALPVKFRGIPTPIPAFGLDNLVNVTLELLPGFIKSGFIAAQRVSQSEKRTLCEDIICSYVRDAQKGFWDKVPLINIYTTNTNIKKMFSKLGQVYNTALVQESIDKVMSDCNLDAENIFKGLVSPIDFGYSAKIDQLLNKKKKEGFKVEIQDLEKNERAARMIAYYGYIFVESIEELWEKFTLSQLKEIDIVVCQLINIINRKLKENTNGSKKE